MIYSDEIVFVMLDHFPKLLLRVLVWMTLLVIVRVTIAVVANYSNYFPPNFESNFLLGREDYFWHGYHRAFYVHLAAGPLSLILGTILISDQFRAKFPVWHRRFGRIQGLIVLGLIAPSGLWMGLYAGAGPIAALGFIALSFATGISMALGWRAAIERRFDQHRRWMWRCYLLLCSAVVIRIIGGATLMLQVESEWIYQVSAWISWMLPLGVYESQRLLRRSLHISRHRSPIPLLHQDQPLIAVASQTQA